MNEREQQDYKEAMRAQRAPEDLIQKTLTQIAKQEEASSETQSSAPTSRPKVFYIKRISALAAAVFLIVLGSLSITQKDIVFNEITAFDLKGVELGQTYTRKENWSIGQLEDYLDAPISQFDKKQTLDSYVITATYRDSKSTKTVNSLLNYSGGEIQLNINKPMNYEAFEKGTQSSIHGTNVCFAKNGTEQYAYFQRNNTPYFIYAKDIDQEIFIDFVKKIIK